MRFVPQWLMAVWCALHRHPQTRYAAWMEGVQVVVYTCKCGRRQTARVLPANRAIRRHVR